ncbi:MAG: uracil-DNA glycosylase [bacterium]
MRNEAAVLARELRGYLRFISEDEICSPTVVGSTVPGTGNSVRAKCTSALASAGTARQRQWPGVRQSRGCLPALEPDSAARNIGQAGKYGGAAVVGTFKAPEVESAAVPHLQAPEAASTAEPTGSSLPHDVRKVSLENLSAEVSVCRKCPLGFSRIKPVFGTGDIRASVMFVGEGPGYEEDRRGEPFVGKAGELLDKILSCIGLSRQQVYIANIVKCHPMINPKTPGARGNDRAPSHEEIAVCKSYLDRQISLISPGCLVALGSVAAKTLLGTSKGITAIRGKWHDCPLRPADGAAKPAGTIKLLPVYHPAALLRNPLLKRETWNDFKELKKFLESGCPGSGNFVRRNNGEPR